MSRLAYATSSASAVQRPFSSAGDDYLHRGVDDSMSVVFIEEFSFGSHDLVDELMSLYELSDDEAERREQEIAHRYDAFDGRLAMIAMNPGVRSDIRGLAARLWVLSVYPPVEEDVTSTSRRQTAYEPLVFQGELIAALVQTGPRLVKLGLLAGLEEVADFRLIKALFAADPDKVVADEARDILQDAE